MDEGNGRDETLDDLEREVERDRAELAGTVEALRGRLGTSGGGLTGALSAGARDYAATRRAGAVDSILRRVEEHPLQTVALAAGIAYPVVRIVTKIPAPILMLGAGVALAGRGGSDRTGGHVEIVVEPADDTHAARAPGTEFREPEIAATEATSPRTPAEADRGTGEAGAAPIAAASEAVSRAGARAARAGRAGGETLLQSIRRNPAAAGGASLLIGAALAAMLPRTRVEARTFGETANDVRERARSMAAEGIEAGRRAVGAAASEAENQNLTGSGARGAIRDGADRVSGTIRDAADDAQVAIEGSGQDDGNAGSQTKSD